jgi:hypothetical protein
MLNRNKPDINWDLDKKIITKLNVIDPQLCDEIVRYGQCNVNPGIDKYPEIFRTSFHSCLLPLNHPIHEILTNVWKEIILHFQFDIDFVEPYELKRYTDEDFFGSHIDNYYSLTDNLDRKITMVLQLSDQSLYKGGDLKILNKFASREKGSITAFPSFFPHEVEKTEGCRWSLIGWAWGPYWK